MPIASQLNERVAPHTTVFKRKSVVCKIAKRETPFVMSAIEWLGVDTVELEVAIHVRIVIRVIYSISGILHF